MSIQGVTERCWILALFIRDDGERFLLGDGAYDFTDKLQHFQPNSIVNDEIEVQGNDGILLAGQVRRAAAQTFEGYIGDATVSKSQVEQYRRQFFTFFRKNHFYTVVYVFPDGTAIKRQRGFLVDDPSVPELWQQYPQYHVALNFEDINYYSYAENADGEEIFGESVELPLSGARSGGEVWDAVGEVWDTVGSVWEAGTGGEAEPVVVSGIDTAYPVWIVNGPIANPRLENITTNTAIVYSGSVAEGQELRIDMNEQTATLNGTNVLGNVSGDWITLAPRSNRVVFSGTSASILTSKIEWQEVVG